jgi:prepilin signal peptidase PulO-like enzyme (type II secretory pathway)
MGQGDVTLLLFAGAWLGLWDLIRTGVLASVVAGIVLVFLLAAKKTTLKGSLPLAPFLFAGAVLNFYL